MCHKPLVHITRPSQCPRVHIPHLAAIHSAILTVCESAWKGISAEALEYMQSVDPGVLAALLFWFLVSSSKMIEDSTGKLEGICMQSWLLCRLFALFWLYWLFLWLYGLYFWLYRLFFLCFYGLYVIYCICIIRKISISKKGYSI